MLAELPSITAKTSAASGVGHFAGAGAESIGWLGWPPPW